MSPHAIVSNSNGYPTSAPTSPNGVTHGRHHPSKPSRHVPRDGFSTRAIHVGSEPSSETNAVIPAISLSTTYKQDGVGLHKGYEYTRSLNPNRHALERLLASLELDATSTYETKALAFASGSATTATVVQAMGPGAHVVSINDVYGGTFRYMSRVAREVQGLEVTYLDFDKVRDEEVIQALKPNTKLIWIETPTNPTLRLPPIHRVTALIHRHFANAPASRPYIAIDATFLSPFYITPLSSPVHADLVVHSLTKYINGHSDVLMGSVALRLPSSTSSSPYETTHPPHPTITQLLEKLIFLQNAHGAVPSAFDAYLAQRGAKTLPLRMKTHGANALRVAQFLREQAKSPEGLVEDVRYPGLVGQKGRETAWKVMSLHAKKWIRSQFGTEGGYQAEQEQENVPTYDFPFGGIVSFKISGGAAEAERFLTRLRLFVLAESLGGVESLAEVPDRMTHGSIPAVERATLGITPNLIRLSVGVEDGEDLVHDIEQALRWAVLEQGEDEYRHVANGVDSH